MTDSDRLAAMNAALRADPDYREGMQFLPVPGGTSPGQLSGYSPQNPELYGITTYRRTIADRPELERVRLRQ
jgi:hypothetical protein